MNCIVCGSGTHKYPAVIGGFISEFVLQAPPATTGLRECNECGVRFFERRYTDEEMHRLYDDYRGERYFTIRHRHEPWYTRKLNDMTMASNAVIQHRKMGIAALVAKHCPTARSLLDYGGDRGQIIPDGIVEKFVFDYAAFEPVADVVKLHELGGRKFDCVLALNVLEHVSDPIDEIQRISRLLLPGGVLIISVPDERPNIVVGYSSVAKLSQLAAVRSRFAAVVIDFFSKVMKFKLNIFPPLSLISQNEHLNFYTSKGLSMLVKPGKILEAGFEAEPDGVFRRSLFVVAKF